MPTSIPPRTGGTNRAVSDRPRTGGKDQRNQTGDKGERGHLNGPKSQFSPFDGCILERQALLPPLYREFDDQDGILAEQTDQHDQTNLSIDVVFDTALLLQQKEEPNTCNGSVRIRASGNIKLSYCPTSTR